ncbi:MAG: LamG-like jellyroll fold domain-containing protein [Alistipes sp.]
MKRIVYFAIALALGVVSCSQDLDQNPPFNYPQTGTGGGGTAMPENCILRMTFDDNLDVEGPYEMLARVNEGEEVFAEGHNGRAYQGAEGKAILLNPTVNAAGLKKLGSFTLTLWINFDGSNSSACTLFGIGHPKLSIANLALFIEGHGKPATNTEVFFFKGYFNGTAEKWFDMGDASKIKTGIQNKWAQIGLVYDGATSTASLYHNGTKLSTNTFDKFGPLAFEEISGLVIGAFPSMVGLSSATTDWPASGSWYTGRLDDFYLYNVAKSDTEMVKQYQDQM